MKKFLGQLVELNGALEALLGVKLPFSVSMAVVENIDKLSSKIKFYQNQRQELFKTYGDPDPKDPDKIIIPPERIQEFGEKLNELVSLEVSIDLDFIDVEAIYKLEEQDIQINIEPINLLVVKRFFKEPEAKETEKEVKEEE